MRRLNGRFVSTNRANDFSFLTPQIPTTLFASEVMRSAKRPLQRFCSSSESTSACLTIHLLIKLKGVFYLKKKTTDHTGNTIFPIGVKCSQYLPWSSLVSFMSFTTLKKSKEKTKRKSWGWNAPPPNYTSVGPGLARLWTGWGLTLLTLLLTQELEYGGEILAGVTTCTHHTVDLMG